MVCTLVHCCSCCDCVVVYTWFGTHGTRAYPGYFYLFFKIVNIWWSNLFRPPPPRECYVLLVTQRQHLFAPLPLLFHPRWLFFWSPPPPFFFLVAKPGICLFFYSWGRLVVFLVVHAEHWALDFLLLFYPCLLWSSLQCTHTQHSCHSLNIVPSCLKSPEIDSWVGRRTVSVVLDWHQT